MPKFQHDLIAMFQEEFENAWPLDSTEYDDFTTTWSVYSSKGVGILRVVLEDVNSLDTEAFEWTLTSRS